MCDSIVILLAGLYYCHSAELQCLVVLEPKASGKLYDDPMNGIQHFV